MAPARARVHFPACCVKCTPNIRILKQVQSCARNRTVHQSVSRLPVATTLAETPGDIILDGFPRTLIQAQWLVHNYANKYDIHVVFLNVPDEIMEKRISKRKREGSTRKDDGDIDIVRHRIETFHTTTMPAIKWLSGVGNITFSDVDSSEHESANFARIVNALNW